MRSSGRWLKRERERVGGVTMLSLSDFLLELWQLREIPACCCVPLCAKYRSFHANFRAELPEELTCGFREAHVMDAEAVQGDRLLVHGEERAVGRRTRLHVQLRHGLLQEEGAIVTPESAAFQKVTKIMTQISC